MTPNVLEKESANDDSPIEFIGSMKQSTTSSTGTLAFKNNKTLMTQHTINWHKMTTHSNALTSDFQVGNFTANDDAVAFDLAGDAIFIWKMDARSGLFHQEIDVLAGSADEMRMKWVAHLHGQSCRWSLQ